MPRTAPGDLVELADGARAPALRPGPARAGCWSRRPDRVEPRCPHYERDECGGCQLQHLDAAAQREARRGVRGRRASPARQARRGRPRARAGRRRVRVPHQAHARRRAPTDGGSAFTATAGPSEIFDLERCHITVPELMELWSVLRRCRRLLPERSRAGRPAAGPRRRAARCCSRGRRRGRGPGPALCRRAGRPGHDGDGLVAARGWRAAGRGRRGRGRFRPRCSSRCTRRWATGCAPSRCGARATVAGRRVWDLYAGIGETTAVLAARRRHGRERGGRSAGGAPRRSRGARPRAAAHRPGGGRALARLRPPDLVITNPPRTGMDARVTAEIERARSGAGGLHLVRSGDTGARPHPAADATGWRSSRRSICFPRRRTWRPSRCWSARREVHRERRRARDRGRDGRRAGDGGGRPHASRCAAIPGTPLRQLIIDGRPTVLCRCERRAGRWAVTVRGERWEAEVGGRADPAHPESDRPARSRPAGHAVLKAPMPGLVVRVLAVEPGQAVAAGAGRGGAGGDEDGERAQGAGAGRGGAVLVQPGEAVEKGQVLVEFGPAGRRHLTRARIRVSCESVLVWLVERDSRTQELVDMKTFTATPNDITARLARG